MNSLYEPKTLTDGMKKEISLREAGFDEGAINSWREETRKGLLDGGFTEEDADKYFGVPKYDGEPLKEGFKKNVESNIALAGTASEPKPVELNPQKPADTFLKSLEMGFQEAGMVMSFKGVPTDYVMPEDASLANKIGEQLGMGVGDVVPITLGAYGGAKLAGPFGAGFGGAFIPAILRHNFMDAYNNGAVKDFDDAWARASHILLESAKEGFVGGLAFGGGSLMGRALLPITGGAFATAAEMTTAVHILTNLGAAMKGKVPEPDDFWVGAGTMLAMSPIGVFSGMTKRLQTHLRETAVKKQMEAYKQTGIAPEQVIVEAKVDPSVKHELLSTEPGPPPFTKSPPKIPEIKPTKDGDLPFIAEKKGDELIVNELGQDGVVYQTISKIKEKIAPKKEKLELDPDVEEGLSHIKTTRPEKKGLPTRDEIEAGIFDNLDPSKRWLEALKDIEEGKATETPTRRKEDVGIGGVHRPYALARNYRNIQERVWLYLKHGEFDFHGNPIGKSFDQTLTELFPTQKEFKEFQVYATHRRIKELYDNGRITEQVITKDKADNIVNKLGKQYEPKLQEFKKHTDNIVKYLVDSGLLNKKVADSFKKTGVHYIRLSKVLDGDKGTLRSKGISPKKVIHKISEGNKLDIVDPVQSTYEFIAWGLQQAEQNKVALAHEKAWIKAGKPEELMRVVNDIKPIEVKSKELIKTLEEQGIITTEQSLRKNLESKGLKVSDEIIDKALENEPRAMDRDTVEAFTIFRQQNGPLKDNQIPLFRDGKRIVYEMPVEVASALKELDSTTQNSVIKALSYYTKVKKTFIMLDPLYTARNLTRDQFWNYIKSGDIPIKELVTGASHILRKSPEWQQWIKSGGSMASLTSNNFKNLQDALPHVYKEGGILNKTYNYLATPYRAKKFLDKLVEDSPRVGHFVKKLKEGKDPVEAAYSSRELMDFGKYGGYQALKNMNSLSAFQGAKIQGYDNLVRSFKKDPKGMLARGSVLASIGIANMLIMMKAGLWDDLTDAEKYLYWHMPGDKFMGRVPQPHEAGLIFSGVSQMMVEGFLKQYPNMFDGLYKEFVAGVDPNDKDLSGLILQQLPLGLPDVPMAIVEHATKEDMHTGNPIVPLASERLSPHHRYTKYTSEWAKKLGEVTKDIPVLDSLGLTQPAILQNYYDEFVAGGLGKTISHYVDKALVSCGIVDDPIKPEQDWQENPFIKSLFLKYPSASSKQILTFRENAKKSQELLNTYRVEMKQYGAGLRKEQPTAPEQYHFMTAKKYEAIKDHDILIRNVYNSKAYTPDEKTDFINRFVEAMIVLSTEANSSYNEAKKGSN